MTVTFKSVENPEEEQWHLLSQFAYPSNIEIYLQQKGFSKIEQETVDFIAGSMRQSEAFFSSAREAPIDISPLLLYYGATNLLTAAWSLLSNSMPAIKNHGMVIQRNKAKRIADVVLIPRSRKTGALQLFCNIFSDSCVITNGAAWTMLEILGSTPDLKQEFENHYKDAKYYTVPVEIVKTRQRTFERLKNAELNRYSNVKDAINRISGFDNAYLTPQFKPEFVIINYKRGGIDIGTHSIAGRKFLQISHLKNGRLVNPNQLIIMVMGLYILGFLPRYHPELWNPFIRSDTTGEKYIIEKFIAVCRRFLPNLVLDTIYGNRIVFIHAQEGTKDLSISITEDEIETVVERIVKRMHQRGELQ